MCMNRSKGAAALMSALVFPGVGQWYLHRRRLALLFAVPALVAGWFYLSYDLDQVNALLGAVQSGAVALDPAAIAARAEAMPTPLPVAACGWVFLVCWVGSVAEALLGKKKV
jgi:hypothetical protein